MFLQSGRVACNAERCCISHSNSVCPSVCLSHARTLSRQMNVGSRGLRCEVACGLRSGKFPNIWDFHLIFLQWPRRPLSGSGASNINSQSHRVSCEHVDCACLDMSSNSTAKSGCPSVQHPCDNDVWTTSSTLSVCRESGQTDCSWNNNKCAFDSYRSRQWLALIVLQSTVHVTNSTQSWNLRHITTIRFPCHCPG